VKNVGFGLKRKRDLNELSLTNNYVYFKVTVVPPYDFLVESITAKPGSPAVVQDCVLTVKVKNNGFAQFRTPRAPTPSAIFFLISPSNPASIR